MGRMRTRLTEMLGIEHPVMLAGMGGVSYHAVVAAVSDAGGFGTLGAATMSSEQLDEEMAAVRAATDKPFGVDLLAALPERMLDDAAQSRDRWCVAVRRRPRRPARRREDPPRRQRARREHVREGAARDRGGGSRLRLRDRAGHRSRWSHRHRRDDATRAADRRRGRRARPGRRRRWHLRRTRPGCRDQPRRRRRVDRARVSSRHPKHAPSAATRKHSCARPKTEL